ncbi:MAG: hypothetical protein JWO13_1669 [Acidobacteriales bacterium]|nr:hypothetical protein [Terriglobales bacterium]
MKTHFLPSEQSIRVARLRATLKTVAVLFVCACLAHLASALYLVEHPAQPSIPQIAGTDGSSHDVALVAPHWAVTTSNIGQKATISAESWQSNATLIREASISGTALYLYKLDSPDASRLGTLQFPESSQEVTIQGKAGSPMRLSLAEDGKGSLSEEVGEFVGRAIMPISDPNAVLGILAEGDGKAVVISTSQLIKAFPELAH